MATPAGLIALTCNEIRRLFTIFVSEPGRALGLSRSLVGLATRPLAPRPNQPLTAPGSSTRVDNDLRLECYVDALDERYVDVEPAIDLAVAVDGDEVRAGQLRGQRALRRNWRVKSSSLPSPAARQTSTMPPRPSSISSR